MSRKCQLTGKVANNGFSISHSHRRTKRLQHVNLQVKRVWWPQGNRWVKLKLSTKAIKTLELKGLDAMAKEAGINLNLF
ncbi:MAG: 50S ribosomal protein L28 [Scytonematopsis contorta HA4267-MV1]|jgi:large subunit ribosomal protein L28|nr:50S ribosomal protein L28 [Scytonematopsis contorta HA4267-MV1]